MSITHLFSSFRIFVIRAVQFRSENFCSIYVGPKVSSPSMRRPVSVKTVCSCLGSSSGLAGAEPPLSPSFHPHSLVSDLRSVQVGCSRFSRCCYLRIDLSSHLSGGSRAPGPSRSHLDSAVELGCRNRNSLGHFPHHFLTIAQGFVHLASYPQPMQQYRQLSSHGHHRSLLGIFSSSLR